MKICPEIAPSILCHHLHETQLQQMSIARPDVSWADIYTFLLFPQLFHLIAASQGISASDVLLRAAVCAFPGLPMLEYLLVFGI